MFYDNSLIDKLIRRGRENKTSAGCRMISRRPQPFENDQFIQFIEGQNGRIVGYEKVHRLTFSIHAPFLFRNEVLPCIQKELAIDPPRTRRLLMRIHDAGGGLSLVQPAHLYNMNWPEDVVCIKKAIQRQNRPWFFK